MVDSSNQQLLIKNWLRLALYIMAFCAFSLGAYWLLQDSSVQATIAFGVFAFCLILAVYGNNLQSIKLFGMEAELQRKLDEAEQLLEKLKKIAVLQAETILDACVAGEFWGQLPREHRLGVREKILDTLKEFGVTPEEVCKTRRVSDKNWAIVYVRTIQAYLQAESNSDSLNSEGKEKVKLAIQNIDSHQSRIEQDRTWMSSAEIRQIFDKYSISPVGTLKTLLNDYLNFESTGEIKGL